MAAWKALRAARSKKEKQSLHVSQPHWKGTYLTFRYLSVSMSPGLGVLNPVLPCGLDWDDNTISTKPPRLSY